MAPHRLSSELEIQMLHMRICPKQARWAAPEENTGYRFLHKGADGLRGMLIALEDTCTSAAHDKDLSVAGFCRHRVELASKALAELRDYKPLTAATRPVEQKPLKERRSRLARDPKGVLRIVGGDNTCWTREELQRRKTC